MRRRQEGVDWPPNNATECGRLGRELPGMYSDKITFGLPSCEARNHRRLYGACVSTAMAAQRRGWTQAQFTDEIARERTGRSRSELWRQLRTQPGGRRRSYASAFRTLHKAWDTATANLRDVGERTAYDLSQDARERALQ